MSAPASTLLSLAERVEAGEGPDRELDAEIAPLQGLRIVDEGHPLGRCVYDQNNHGVPLPAYTASLDAAVTLVPEGVFPRLDFGGAQAIIVRRAVVGFREVARSSLCSTPARALAAACLRAKAQIVEAGNG